LALCFDFCAKFRAFGALFRLFVQRHEATNLEQMRDRLDCLDESDSVNEIVFEKKRLLLIIDMDQYEG
jgi:hypothetical protein